MNFYENWVELDLNPILTFSNIGKILYSNAEAQFLLNRISSKELYDLALKYAPLTFGFNTTYINLKVQNYIFYAITVGYEDENSLYVKLYKSTMVKKENKLSTKNAEFANIFTLVDLNISTLKTKKQIQFIKHYDPSIPEFKMIVPELLKVIGKVYDSFKEATTITTSIKLKIGEYIKIESVKYSLISIEISTDGYVTYSEPLENNSNSYILTKEENKITIDLPLVLN
jgi:nitrogen-specific signal transduction histidine kinase